MSVEYKIEDDNKKDSTIKVVCNKCGIDINHSVIHNHVVRGEEVYNDIPGATINWFDDYQIIKCAGCDTASFRHEAWFSEDYNGDDDPGVRELLYPHRKKDGLKVHEQPNVPINLKRIYRETVECFNNESYTLAAAGLRALVEGLCANLGIADGPVIENGVAKRKNNLEGKINGLAEKHVLTKQGADTLHEHRFLGNEAIHELSQPSAEELRLATELLDHTFKTVFDVPQMYTDLKHRRGKRVQKESK